MRFSGITPKSLESVSTTLSDVQSHLLNLFQPAHTIILVGQSLNSDLNAIKLMHPYIIDTALIFDHKRGKPYRPSLKWLAIKYLQRDIQRGRKKAGHDSTEDALACIDLVKIKLEKGLAFGVRGRSHAKMVVVDVPGELWVDDDNSDGSPWAQTPRRRSKSKKKGKPKQNYGRWKYYVGGIVFLLFLLFKN